MVKLISYKMILDKSKLPNEVVKKVSYNNNIIKINYENYNLFIVTTKRQNKKSISKLDIVNKKITSIEYNDELESFCIVCDDGRYYRIFSKNKIKFQIVCKKINQENFMQKFVYWLILLYAIIFYKRNYLF
jgi:hypothetical protein